MKRHVDLRVVELLFVIVVLLVDGVGSVEMFAAHVTLNVRADVHADVAASPGTLIHDAYVFSLLKMRKTETYVMMESCQ